MQTIDVSLPKPHRSQAEALKSTARFTLFNCGRRWGKDVILMRRAIKAAINKKPVGWFAPTYKMLSENWKEIKFRVSPIASRINEQEKHIVLMSGGLIDFWSLDVHDAARGRKYGHVAINECAMVKGLADAWNMVIRPTLADVRGGADFGSTPKGLNDFFTLWSAAADKPDWARFHYTTYDNPYIPRDELDALKTALPERVFLQEIMAEFIADGSYFQGIDAAAVIEHPDIPAEHNHHYLTMGVDWAIFQDFTVLTVGCRDCNRIVDWERFNQIGFAYQREKLLDMAHRWKVSGVLPERNSIGVPNIELLMGNVPVLPGPDDLPGFNTLPSTKPQLIQGLASALEHHGYKVPKAAADELRAYEVEMLESGKPKFGAPSGLHDDWVISLALTWRAMTMAARLPDTQPANKSRWNADRVEDGESRWRRY